MEEDIFLIERVSSNHIKWKFGQKEKIIELYKNGDSLRVISSKFNGLHRNTIKKILAENNILLRSKSESYSKDSRKVNIFSQIDSEEKAYWLGFLAADGCVSGNYIIITLQRRDREHLEKFKRFLNVSSVKILDYKEKTSFSSQIRDYSKFSVGCKQMAGDLKKWGVTERKSTTLNPPNIPREYYLDWIRGYFDGNGCLSCDQTGRRWQSSVLSTKQVCEWIRETLNIKRLPHRQSHYGNFDNIWVLGFNGRLQVYRAWNEMFRDNTVKVYLNRKYFKYLKLRATIEKN